MVTSPPAAETSTSASGTASPRAGSPPQEPASEAWRRAAIQLGLIREFAAHYLQARIDSAKLTVRRLVVLAAIGLVGLVALASVAVMMVVFLFDGIAGAFSALFHGNFWLGELVTMGIFVLVLTAAGSWALGAMSRASKRRTVEKYESRQSQQRVNFGTDVHQRAGSA